MITDENRQIDLQEAIEAEVPRMLNGRDAEIAADIEDRFDISAAAVLRAFELDRQERAYRTVELEFRRQHPVEDGGQQNNPTYYAK